MTYHCCMLKLFRLFSLDEFSTLLFRFIEYFFHSAQDVKKSCKLKLVSFSENFSLGRINAAINEHFKCGTFTETFCIELII